MNPDIWTILAAFGLCQIILHGDVFLIVREFLKWLHPLVSKLLTCAMCIGFWCGVACAICFEPGSFLLQLKTGLVSAAVCLVGDMLLNYLDENICFLMD